MAIYLQGLGLQNYRGVGPEIQFMAPFKDFNFFIGANNAGKSTVLRAISDWLPVIFSMDPSPKSNSASTADKFKGGINGEPQILIAIDKKSMREKFPEPKNPHTSNLFDTLIENISVKDLVCTEYGLRTYQEFSSAEIYLDKNKNIQHLLTNTNHWSELFEHLTGMKGGELTNHWIPQSWIRIKNYAHYRPRKPILIPAQRKMGNTHEAFEGFGGQGLINRLAEIQSPNLDKRHEHDLYLKINRFLAELIEEKDARIEVIHDRSAIHAHLNKKVLPLDSLGTGIEEIILIAAYCTMTSDTIICIEEPELHLHPILQRKLIQYLKDNTNNQYFIATHSAAFIDTPDAAIFHVYQEDGQTKIRSANLPSHKHSVCRDLGYRASDIVQSNFVIWCEGPSDRIYLNHWISHKAPELVEGTHYSIMFYGGRLLSHLSADDDEVTEFISLNAINRNAAILIDSDKSSNRARLNATKGRIVRECGNADWLCWVTKGREIENYIDFGKLQSSIKKAHSSKYDRPANSGELFDDAMSFHLSQRKLETANADKVKIAKLVCDEPPDFTKLDLDARVTELVDRIKAANHLS